MKHKMYCVFAKESVDKINGVRGKMCTQAGHAYLHTFMNAMAETPELAAAYLDSGHSYKITLLVDTVEQLQELQEDFKKHIRMFVLHNSSPTKALQSLRNLLRLVLVSVL